MRVLLSGTFGDHQVQLANVLSRSEQMMVLVPYSGVPDVLRAQVKGDYRIEAFGRGRRLRRPEVIASIWETLRIVRMFKPDLIHMELVGHLPDLALLPLFSRYPIVVTFHDVTMHYGEESLKSSIIRWMVRRKARMIIVHGQRLKETLIRNYRVPADKVEVIPLGAPELEQFRRYERIDIREEWPMVLFFGRIHRYKGLEYLISAEPMIAKQFPNVRIFIAGTGEDFARYREMMAGREDRFVVLNRHIPSDEGAELFQKCSVVVLPYAEGSQSGVIPIAYYFKKPVVVTDVGSLSEVVRDGETGLVVPPKDPKALAEALVRLLGNGDLRRRMGERGRYMLETDLGWEGIAAKTKSVYERAIKSSRKGDPRRPEGIELS